jgi:uncharacterized protein (TIGR03067 family)
MRTLAVLFVLLTPVQDEDRIKFEQEKLEGTWKVIRAESDGQKVPDDALKGFKMVFKGDTYTAHIGEDKTEGTYKLDLRKSPRRMDILPKTGSDKGKVQLAIYQLQGNMLTICGAQPDKDRPTKFDTKDQPGCSLMVLRRVP